MPSFRKTIIATRILLLAGTSITTPAAAATFDGAWNVQIASTSSACGERTKRFDRDQQRPGCFQQRDGHRIGPRRRGRQHQRDLDQRDEAGRRLRSSHSAHRDQAPGAARCARAPGPRSESDRRSAGGCTARQLFSDRCGIFRVGHLLHPGRDNFRPAIPASRCGSCRWSASRHASVFRPAESRPHRPAGSRAPGRPWSEPGRLPR